jgi:hypothetical protein
MEGYIGSHRIAVAEEQQYQNIMPQYFDPAKVTMAPSENK